MSPGQELSLGFESIFIKSLFRVSDILELAAYCSQIRKKSAEAPKGIPAFTHPLPPSPSPHTCEKQGFEEG